MYKKFLIIVLILFVVSISGCTMKEGETGTFGEKNISINSIKVLNNTNAWHYESNGINKYAIKGTLQNQNNYTAFNVKMKAVVYDKNGKIITTNENVTLDPKNIPASGQSQFIFRFVDQNNSITNYKLQVISADIMH